MAPGGALLKGIVAAVVGYFVLVGALTSFHTYVYRDSIENDPFRFESAVFAGNFPAGQKPDIETLTRNQLQLLLRVYGVVIALFLPVISLPAYFVLKGSQRVRTARGLILAACATIPFSVIALALISAGKFGDDPLITLNYK